MSNLKIILFVLLVCASGWAQSGSTDSAAKLPVPDNPQPAQDSSASSQTPSNLPADSTKLEPIKTQKAIYPLEAQNHALQGEVMVKIVISENGDVESAEATIGDPVFTKSAVDAAKKWKFKPFIKNGKPVKVSTKIPFDFAFTEKIMEKGVTADGSTSSDAKSVRAPLPEPPAAEYAAVPTYAAKRVRVSSGISQGLLIRQIAPVYPREARRDRIQGTVILHAVINKEGRIADLRLVSGPKELAQAAIGAVQQWVYRPYELMGNPVEVDTEIQVNFRLQ